MKLNRRMTCSVLLALSAFMLAPAHAYFLDSLDNTDNLVTNNPNTSISSLTVGSGTVTFLRDDLDDDTSIDWRESGTGFFDLATESQLVITPDAIGSSNAGGYTVNVIFYNDISYVTELTVVPNTSSTSVQSIDLTSFSGSYGASDRWFARFRQVDDLSPVFEFDSIAATIPEPSTGVLVALALGAAFLFRRRFRA
mgnify:CR=1 FL=1